MSIKIVTGHVLLASLLSIHYKEVWGKQDLLTRGDWLEKRNRGGWGRFEKSYHSLDSMAMPSDIISSS